MVAPTRSAARAPVQAGIAGHDRGATLADNDKPFLGKNC
jgi:hypothetical protein